jgi:hypothetical protein
MGQGSLLLSMLASLLVVIGQNDQVAIFQPVPGIAWQAITDTAERERRLVQSVERIDILLAFWPQDVIGDELRIEWIDCDASVWDCLIVVGLLRLPANRNVIVENAIVVGPRKLRIILLDLDAHRGAAGRIEAHELGRMADKLKLLPDQPHHF